MVGAVIEETDRRRVRIHGRWLDDFASSGYLGLDLDQDIISALPDYLLAWGTQTGRPRLMGSPSLVEQIETALAALVGTEEALLFPTTADLHLSVIPLLAGSGSVFVDARAHKSIADGCGVARSHGATVQRFRHGDPRDLERLLGHSRSSPRVVCMDGVNGFTGNVVDLVPFARIARRYDALLYIDDSYGFGVVGERRADEACDYGVRGNGVVRHHGESYDNVVLVAGLSHAYSTMVAFVACPAELKDLLKTAAWPQLYSPLPPVASLAAAVESLAVNQRAGEAIRLSLHRKSHQVLDAVEALGIWTANASGHPLIHLPARKATDLEDLGLELFRRGIYAALAPSPLVSTEEIGIRLEITAAHSDAQVEHLVGALGELSGHFRPRHGNPRMRLVGPSGRGQVQRPLRRGAPPAGASDEAGGRRPA